MKSRSRSNIFWRRNLSANWSSFRPSRKPRRLLWSAGIFQSARLISAEQGLQDIVLTTEQKPGKGGKIVCTKPLTWVGAEEGGAWKKRPLPLCMSRNCAFRPGVTRALDHAGIDWVDIVSSDDDLAGEAITSADLGIRAEMKDAIYAGARVIEHGGQLPELPKFSIILYCDSRSGNHLTATLAEYLTRAYA